MPLAGFEACDQTNKRLQTYGHRDTVRLADEAASSTEEHRIKWPECDEFCLWCDVRSRSWRAASLLRLSALERLK